MEFIDEVTPLLPIFNSTIIRVVRAFLHECFYKSYSNNPILNQELTLKDMWCRY